MQLKELEMKNSTIIWIEVRKCFDKNTYIVSAVYFFLLTLITQFNITLQRVLSKSNVHLQILSSSTIEGSVFNSVFSRGIVVFAILIIVTFGKELSYGTFRKSLVTGYNRFDVFFGSLIRINIFAVLFIVLTGFVVLMFHNLSYNLSHDNKFIFRIISIYFGFLYVGLASFCIVLLTERIYLSIIIITFLILSIPAIFLLNQINAYSRFVIFLPFIVLKYLNEPFRIFLNNYFYASYFIYFFLFSWISFSLIARKNFL